MFVATIKNRQKGRVYETHLIRRTYREGGKVKNETIANITRLPAATREAIKRTLLGEVLVPANQVQIEASRAHGHVALIRGVIKDCGLRNILLSTDSRQRRVVEALIVARILEPLSKLGTTRFWKTTTLAQDLDIDDVDENEVYTTLDWLAKHQPRIERRLGKKHLEDGCLVLYDMSSSWMTGTQCPLAKRGYSRDGKRGTLQITYGAICDKEGRPLAIEVFSGNTNDTTTVIDQVKKAKKQFGLERLVFVGDRGMIKQTRIAELRELEGVDWISALDAKQVQKLRQAGDLQLGLFDQRNLGEITSEQFPNERLIVCRNPLLTKQRQHTREALLADTQARLDKIASSVAAGRLTDPGEIGERVGRAWGQQKMRKHFKLEISAGCFRYELDGESIEREASLDGLYVLRTSLEDSDKHPSSDVVRDYKRLCWLERTFRVLKTTHLLVRPVYHYTETRVRAHVFLCLLAAHVVWELERRLGSLLFHEEDREQRKTQADPVVPLKRSKAAQRKDSKKTSDDGHPLHSLQTLLAQLATLQRHTMRIGDSQATWQQLTLPTQHQQRVFKLAGVKLV